MFVWGIEEVRRRRDRPGTLRSRHRWGRTFALGDVADLAIVPTASEITREGASRQDRRDVQRGRAQPGERRPRDRAEGARAVVQARRVPPRVPGRVRRSRGIAPAAPDGLSALSLLGVLLVIQSDFRTARLTALVFLTLPFALIGGVFGAVWGGGVLSLGSLVGFVTVLGIAARNGIMLVSHYRHLETEEGEPFGPGLVIRGVGGAARTDPDDRAGDRPGAGAAGRRRQQAGPRDRAPDGGRDPRRAGHLDPDQPLPDARALPAFAGPRPGGRDWRSGTGSRPGPEQPLVAEGSPAAQQPVTVMHGGAGPAPAAS